MRQCKIRKINNKKTVFRQKRRTLRKNYLIRGYVLIFSDGVLNF